MFRGAPRADIVGVGLLYNYRVGSTSVGRRYIDTPLLIGRDRVWELFWNMDIEHMWLISLLTFTYHLFCHVKWARWNLVYIGCDQGNFEYLIKN